MASGASHGPGIEAFHRFAVRPADERYHENPLTPALSPTGERECSYDRIASAGFISLSSPTIVSGRGRVRNAAR
jgi:hypothetical protein